jgi:hypothetical protein
MDASEGLLRGIAWRLAFLVVLVFIARHVPDNRPETRPDMLADAAPVITSGAHANVDAQVAAR